MAAQLEDIIHQVEISLLENQNAAELADQVHLNSRSWRGRDQTLSRRYQRRAASRPMTLDVREEPSAANSSIVACRGSALSSGVGSGVWGCDSLQSEKSSVCFERGEVLSSLRWWALANHHIEFLDCRFGKLSLSPNNIDIKIHFVGTLSFYAATRRDPDSNTIQIANSCVPDISQTVLQSLVQAPDYFQRDISGLPDTTSIAPWCAPPLEPRSRPTGICRRT